MNQNTKAVDGIQIGFDSSWIAELANPLHFSTYHKQAELVYRLSRRCDSILAIGTGNNLLYNLLKKRKWNVKLLDVDRDKNPDFCDNALEFDYGKLEFKVILAFEVLEHISWNTFIKVLRKISESKIERMIFSVPIAEHQLLKLECKLLRIQAFNLRLTVPSKQIKVKTHFWDLSRFPEQLKDNRRTISLQEFEEAFNDAGFSLHRSGNVDRIPFFHAKKKRN